MLRVSICMGFSLSFGFNGTNELKCETAHSDYLMQTHFVTSKHCYSKWETLVYNQNYLLLCLYNSFHSCILMCICYRFVSAHRHSVAASVRVYNVVSFIFVFTYIPIFVYAVLFLSFNFFFSCRSFIQPTTTTTTTSVSDTLCHMRAWLYRKMHSNSANASKLITFLSMQVK